MDISDPQHFCCSCYSDEHMLRFCYIPDDDYSEVCASVMLSEYGGFWRRVWRAIKYAFGYRCKYGHFDSFILREKDLDALVSLLEAYRSDIRKRKQGQNPA